MKTRIVRLAATALVSGAVGLAGLTLATGSAQADGPSYTGGNCPGSYTCTHWCPGDPLIPGSEFGAISWDWNICHDWYWNSVGTVDVATNIVYPWHGTPHDNGPPSPALPPYVPPPPPQPLPPDCPWYSPILAPSRCGGL
jgi:hypothetical protein